MEPETACVVQPEPARHDVLRAAGAAWFDAMRRGDFAASFRANDEVLRARDAAERDDPSVPFHERWVWDGRQLDGRDVLVRCYHGLGDTIQFARFLPELGRRAAQVTVEAQPALIPLLRQLPGIGRLHPFDPARPLPAQDAAVEVMELAHALRQPPDPAPFLRAAPLACGFGRVGFCWAGGGWDAERDLPPDLLRPVLDEPGVHPISLQRGSASAALAMDDPLGGSMDMVALAGLIAGLQAVVTVDTMVAHMAGALGRPVFLLLKHDADWRWGKEGAWYRTVRQFRQDREGDWSGSTDRLRLALAGFLSGNSGLAERLMAP